MESPTLGGMPPTPTLDQVARNRIRQWITATGMRQTSLADRIGKKQAWLSRYLAGEFDADLETLRKIALAFGHSITALLDLPVDPEASRVVDLHNALSPESRQLHLELLEDWTHQSRSGRGRR